MALTSSDETELWALLDEIQQWRTSDQCQLSSLAEVFLASRHRSVKCEEIFALWRMQVKVPVCERLVFFSHRP
jgi:hypothetical protein